MAWAAYRWVPVVLLGKWIPCGDEIKNMKNIRLRLNDDSRVCPGFLKAGLISGFLAVAGLLLLFSPADLRAESYLIGPEDVVEVTFWQDPGLNVVVRVRNDGKITLDIIGEITAAGVTESDLQSEIVRRISRINPQISQATVRVVEYNSLRVFVFGEVKTPGKFTFERIPDLWTLINEAGGVTAIGDLTRVRIIRGGAEQGTVEEVDVAGMLSKGKAKELPVIRSGDTIELVKTFGSVERPRVTELTGLRNLYYIIGEINGPGAHPMEQNIDLLDAIALAGGPTSAADLSRVRVLSKDGSYSQVVTFDVQQYTETGQPARYFIRPEDTIVLPTRGSGFLGLNRASDYVAVVGALTSLFLLVDRLR